MADEIPPSPPDDPASGSSRPGGGPPAGDPPGGVDEQTRASWRAALPATRRGAQAAHILTHVPHAAPGPIGWSEGGIEYFHRAGHLVVREDDWERVAGHPHLSAARMLDHVGGRPLSSARLVALGERPDGVGPDEHAPRAAAAVNDTHGAGTAALDYFVGVSPGGWCPASEPDAPAGTPAPTPAPPPAEGPPVGEGVKVVVIDLGFGPGEPTPAHWWLTGVTGDPENAYSDTTAADPSAWVIRPYAGHGTFVAGVLRAVAPKADVVVRRALVPASETAIDPSLAGGQFESDLVATLLDVLTTENPDVICMPAGTYAEPGSPPAGFAVFGAVLAAHNRDAAASGGTVRQTVLVTAAGNDATTQPFWPAASDFAVGVGALDAGALAAAAAPTPGPFARAAYSNHGPWVDVFAPGTDLVNAYLTGTYRYLEAVEAGDAKPADAVFHGLARWSGTSFATPVVAGLVAAAVWKRSVPAPKAWEHVLAAGRALAQRGQEIPAVALPGAF
jgi:hypothetical protein